MIRNIFVTLFFFFGPALIMLMLRNLYLFWLFRQRIKRQHPDIIDITPQQHQGTPPSRFFLASAITVGLIFAWLAWSQMHRQPSVENMQYVPAHIDQNGQLVDGHYINKNHP